LFFILTAIFKFRYQDIDRSRPRKGILKASSSYGNICGTDLNPEVLENLQKLLLSNNDFSDATTPSIVKSLLVADVKKEERSDSGRESEDQVKEQKKKIMLVGLDLSQKS
jgi:hypothetical protein